MSALGRRYVVTATAGVEGFCQTDAWLHQFNLLLNTLRRIAHYNHPQSHSPIFPRLVLTGLKIERSTRRKNKSKHYEFN
jgi:hypothetical protein